ncbi:MAG: hypothetical protein HYV40_05155 [Candidatus Levybacteria bacterium]|nr:hypothetical protein [Candidatus Levybacteria bacterium]
MSHPETGFSGNGDASRTSEADPTPPVVYVETPLGKIPVVSFGTTPQTQHPIPVDLQESLSTQSLSRGEKVVVAFEIVAMGAGAVTDAFAAFLLFVGHEGSAGIAGVIGTTAFFEGYNRVHKRARN